MLVPSPLTALPTHWTIDAMNSRARFLLLTIAVLIAFWLIWSRLNFVVFVNASFWQILLVFGVLAVVIFLGLDHLINRSRGDS